MAPRAQWKGYLKFDEISCQVALYTAASTSERTSFHTVNKETGNRVKREFVDEKTGKPVDRFDQVKGYETDDGHYIILEQEEIDAAVPQSDKILAVDSFVPLNAIDTVFFDKPYYLAPVDKVGAEAFALIREGMKARKTAALAHAVLFRRLRTLMIRPLDRGLVANTLNFDYQVRSADEAFSDVPAPKMKKEMLQLATHIIDTMSGEFHPAQFEDRYEAALTELVRAKIEGRAVKRAKPRKEAKVVDLMEALRRSAEVVAKPAKKTGRKAA